MCRICRAAETSGLSVRSQTTLTGFQESSREILSPGGGGGEGFPRNIHNFFYRLNATTSPLAREPSWMSKCQSSRMQACSARTPTFLVSLQLLSLATTMRTAIFRNSFSFFYPKANSSNSFATLSQVTWPDLPLVTSPSMPRSVHGLRLRKCLCIFGDDTFCTPKPDSDSEAPFPATVI